MIFKVIFLLFTLQMKESSSQDKLGSQWTACSVTCGGGTRTKKTCQESSFGGDTKCTEEIEDCNIQVCSVDKVGSQWTACSVTCGGGTRTKKTCQESSFGGDTKCTEEIEDCNIQVCSDKLGSQWTACSVTCGGGTRTKKTCQESSFGGDTKCTEEKEDCNIQVCSVDKLGSQWTACSVTCGGGTRTKKTCQESSFGGDTKCTEETEDCNIQVCSDKLGSQWTACSVTCGGGTRTKKTCQESSFGGDTKCTEEIEDCNIQVCNVDKLGSQLTACSVTCGGGTRTKKTCQESSFGGDTKCTEEKEDCNIQVCSDKPVSQWTECSVTCGEGTRTKKTCKESSSSRKKKVCKKETENCYKQYCRAPCQCNLMVSDLKLCMALHKDDISINFNGTCYPEKLFNAIKFLKKKLEILTSQDTDFERCQTKLKEYLPKYIFEYNKCSTNINLYLKKWKSVLQLKINQLSNEYDEYDQLLFKVTDNVMFEMPGEIKIKKDNFITSFPTLGNTYSISFELKVPKTSKTDIFTSIISLTQMNTQSNMEKNILELLIANHGSVYQLILLFEDIVKYGNKAIYLINEWSHLSISKVKIDGKYKLTVKLNGDIHFNEEVLENHYSDIKLYATRPGKREQNSDTFEVFEGSIKNIKIEDLDLMEKSGN